MRPSLLYDWFAEVTTLRGVGGKVAQALVRLLSRMAGVEAESADFIPRLKDLLFHVPVDAVDRRYTPPLLKAEAGKTITALITVEKHAPPRKGSRSPYRISCANDSGSLILVYFNADRKWLETAFPEGAKRWVSGRVELYDGVLQMPHPDIVALPEEREKVMKLEPVYPLTEGITSRRLAGWIEQAFARVKKLPEWQDSAYRKQQGWDGFYESLRALHSPETKAMLAQDSPARLRLAYDELLASQLALALIRTNLKRSPGHKVEGASALAAQVESSLPFTLTPGQQAVLAEIRQDMASGGRMLRLLQGDVGSGKTVLALLAALDCVGHGLQAALMAPTEILARQHARGLAEILKDTDIRVELLTGSLKAAQRAEAMQRIASGAAQIVVGTHALFQQQVAFHRLGLVVIDEQHRFGVAQRMALSSKGVMPHILLMTATPIPRSLTMTLYGDIECSALTEKPPGRQEIDTRALPLSRLREVVDAVARAKEKGAKIYWICPLVEGKGDISLEESADMQAAEDRHAALKVTFGERVGLVHGRMKAEARQKVMQGFAGDMYDILVATTVIEVGVDVPAATVIIIENAERFGLAQLHQLRGRVGRGKQPSTCLLLYNPQCSEIARQRLKIIRATTDGFTIAEEDLHLRGSGEILGTRQSGMPEFHFADVYVHRELMKVAQGDMKLMLQRDPHLTSERGKQLRNLLYLFGHDQSMRWLESG